jgi:hypothetical protein
MARASSGGSRKAAQGKSRSTKQSSSAKRSRSKQSSGGNRSARSSNGSSPKGIPDYSIVDPKDFEESTDVYLDIPVIQVDEIKFELDDFEAHLAVLAEAGNFVHLAVGAGVRLGKVELDIQGVETQALLEARLHNVEAILARVLTSLDRNPQLLESVGEALGDVGGGARSLLGETGDTLKSVGKGADQALQDVGQGAGRGVAGIGQGAQQGVEGLGQGAQQGVEGLGQGAAQGVEGLGQGAGQGVQGVGQGAAQGVQKLAGGGGS